MRNKLLFIISLFVIITGTINAQVLLNEQFNYPVGDSVTPHGWIVHSGGTANQIYCTSGSLIYGGYATSAGNKAFVNNSGQDISKTFTAQAAGTNLYVGFLMNVATATTTADYFFHLKGTSTTIFYARVYIQKDATQNKYKIGVLKGSTAANIVYGSTLYDFGTTNLVVLKYMIKTGTTNDSVALFVNPATASEGTPTITATDVTSTDLDLVSQGVALRQGSSANNLTLSVDEIRVATTWSDMIGTGVISAPTVLTSSTSNITALTASCSGNVSFDGGSAITQRGICYSTSLNPDTSSLKIFVTGTTGLFFANLAGLSGNTIYHYRAFAQNSIGVSYGSDSTFITASSAVAPVIATDSIANITATSALPYGTVLNDGGSTIIARGICWSLNSNPTLNDNFTTTVGTIGYFQSLLSNLISGTTYHIRAYATNSIGTSYGTDLTFTTVTILPTYLISQIRTVNVTTGVPDSLNVNCRIQGIVHGVNLGTTGLSFFMMDANSGINVFKTTGNAGYTVTEGDKINVMGKIANYNGLMEIVADSIVKISSGNILSTPLLVTTLDESTESRLVRMDSLIYVSGWPTTSANANVNLLRGSQAILLRVYGSSNLYTATPPTSMFSVIGIGNQYIAASPYLGGYQLSPRYLADVTSNPSDSTLTHLNITSTTAECLGKVSYDWGSTITSRGICYGTIINPTLSNSHLAVAGTTGTFTASLTGLTPNTLYHYRAYATNSNGTSYGSDSTFSTSVSLFPTTLKITSINNSKTISANTPFSVTIQAIDNAGDPKNVLINTKVLLITNGTIGGTTFGYITAGTSSVTISGVTLAAGNNINISAIDSASNLSTFTSSNFNILDAASKLAFIGVPSSALSFQTLNFAVNALRNDNSIDSNFTGNVTLNIISGTGNMLGTTTKIAISGITTYNDISFDQAGSYQINASSNGLTSTSNASINLTAGPQMIELVVPKYIGCKNSSTNTQRTPIAICLQFKNLDPDTIYDIKAQIGALTDTSTLFGAGNLWNGTAFSGSNYNQAFSTDANGNSQPVWIYLTSTGNATRFEAGQVHNLRVGYAKTGGTISSKPNFIGTKTITALDIAKTARTTSNTDDGAYLRGTADSTASGKYILIYDNVNGTGSPLSSYQIRQSAATQSTQTDLPRQIDSVYMQAGTTKKGDYALIIPTSTINPLGVRRIEARNADNSIYAFNTSNDGTWTSGVNTAIVNRRDSIKISLNDAPLVPITSKKLNVTAMLQNLYDPYLGYMYHTQDIDWIEGTLFNTFQGNVVDTLSIIIRNATTYDVEYTYNSLELNSNGSITELNLPLNISGNYYIVLIHRNSVETWSEPISFSSSNISYNFFTAPVSTIFLGNMQAAGNNNLIWGGDINNDGTVNIFDLSSVFDAINDPFGILSAGYNGNDLTGDGVVNIFDLSLVFDNLNLGVGSVNPFTIK